MKERFYEDMRYTQNRELSWLRFNQRVLQEAEDPQVPLFEKLKFISIFSSNLDEFFMVRVGSLYDLSQLEEPPIDNKTGMTAAQQLNRIFEAVKPLYKERDKLMEQVEKGLAKHHVRNLKIKDLKSDERKFIDRYFASQVLPVLSPQVVDFFRPFPHLENKNLYIIVTLKGKKSKSFGIIPLPSLLARVIFLPGEGLRFVLLEELLVKYAQDVFEMYQVQDKAVVTVTRNADISPEDEGFDVEDNYRHIMRNMLKKRARLAPVKLNTQGKISDEMEEYLCTCLDLKKSQIFRGECPLNLDYVFPLEERLPEPDARHLLYPRFVPQYPVAADKSRSLIEQAEERDLLLHYPYEEMEPFLQLVREAAGDPLVVSIKITIYRIANKARLAEYLCAAAENGKDVVVLMELRARFDEQNNINWAEVLEEAGCSIIYGFENYKVHSKLCLIIRRGLDNQVRYITQAGTGNYNEKTAKLYTDLSLITANHELGAETASFFKNMALSNLYGNYQSLLVAPVNLKSGIMALLNEEIAKAKSGGEGYALIKVNSITDRELIDKLQEACAAGVKIELIVRGICCILPGIAGKTETLTVRSIVGRFLEHARVYCFGRGEALKMYISSADMMTRNTERRVEIAFPVLAADVRERILAMLRCQLADNVKARLLLDDGTYAKVPAEEEEERINCQEVFLEAVRQAAMQKLHQGASADRNPET